MHLSILLLILLSDAGLQIDEAHYTHHESQSDMCIPGTYITAKCESDIVRGFDKKDSY